VIREEALNTVRANVKNGNLIKHMLAAEAIMRALAKRFGEDEEEWGLTGLLHDIDIELIGDNFADHGRLGADLAAEQDVSPQVCHAIMCHNWTNGIPCVTLLDSALLCTDPLTGLITAGALIRPDKKLAGLTVESLMKRFGERRFAAGAGREQIAYCSAIGLDLEEFIGIGLEAMKGIADELGL
jgi:putative nucleotidyltransferase with HDIG domain